MMSDYEVRKEIERATVTRMYSSASPAPVAHSVGDAKGRAADLANISIRITGSRKKACGVQDPVNLDDMFAWTDWFWRRILESVQGHRVQRW